MLTHCLVSMCPQYVYKNSRCQFHYLEQQRLRNQDPKRQAYVDPTYIRAKALFKGATCWICGMAGSDTVDHVKPLALGGTNDWANLKPAHGPCNSGRKV